MEKGLLGVGGGEGSGFVASLSHYCRTIGILTRASGRGRKDPPWWDRNRCLCVCACARGHGQCDYTVLRLRTPHPLLAFLFFFLFFSSSVVATEAPLCVGGPSCVF